MVEDYNEYIDNLYNHTTNQEAEILERKGFARQTTNPFPDTKLIMEALNRPKGSPLYHGDYEVATLLLDMKGEEAMWRYFDKRLCDNLDRIDYKLTRMIKK